MKDTLWFDDLPVIGKMPEQQVAARLQELEVSPPMRQTLGPTLGSPPIRKSWNPFEPKLWQHTAHTFGYLPSGPGLGGGKLLEICHAGQIKADAGLKNSRIKITLDRLRVADYPGYGMHRILFDFYAQNQLPNEVESLHYNATYRVQSGEHAGITGYPIFVGLRVGGEGVSFRCYTVNVKNDQDETFLEFLESDEFRQGLRLLEGAQPVIAPFSQMAYNLTRSIAKRNRNVPVQEFHMGLDFSDIPTRARLAEGAYIAVQIPESEQSGWDWGQWRFNPASGQIHHEESPQQMIPYNYLVFSISRYQGD
ncbi:MAG: hypothetical protein DM484_28375 [Candidatus Methylumidiphilus alinenensis]|uniref:Uncharacterized protein n=1 Tax=Candidatus Methylumidiphilus alinenensis TaxID=2202197 RepID=A0A2W4QE39_9GAMM|nr:MAG: hypothetical protein DM484_28375 [Candidatus Methylumidiphilus alinenensis]